MVTLEEKKQIIQEHNPKVELGKEIVFTKEDSETLTKLQNLGFENTPQTKDLELTREAAEEYEKQSEYNDQIRKFESLGLKILTKSFVKEFIEDHDMSIFRAYKYIKNIPKKNLDTIYDRLNIFSKNIESLTPVVDLYKGIEYNDISDLRTKCKNNLYMLAPEEHFDKSLTTKDPDPIALYDLGKTWLYLDAWDLDGYMFKSKINLPEVNN